MEQHLQQGCDVAAIILIIICGSIAAACLRMAMNQMRKIAEERIEKLNEQFDQDEHIGI